MRIYNIFSNKYIVVIVIAVILVSCCAIRYISQKAMAQQEFKILSDIKRASPEQLIQYTVWAYNNKNYEVAEGLSIIQNSANFDSWIHKYKVVSIEEADVYIEYRHLMQQFSHIKQYRVKLSYTYRLFMKGITIKDFIFVYDSKRLRWYLYAFGSY